MPAGERPLQGPVRRLDADVAHDVRDQPQGDAVAPLPLRDRLGHGGEDLAAVGAVREMGRDGEVGLGVDDVLVRLLGQQVEHQELEVLGPAQRPRAGEVDLDEVLEVGEAEPALEPGLVLRRQVDAVPPRQLQQHGRAHGAFEVDVELDLGQAQQEAIEAHAVHRRALGAQPLAQPGEHRLGDQAGQVAAQGEDLLDQPAGEVDVVLLGHHEDGLDPRVEPPVHQRHLELVLEVRDGAQAAHHGAGAHPVHEVDQQAGEALDPAPRPIDHLADRLDPLLDGEQRLLSFVDQHGHDHLVEQRTATLDDVEVAVVDGVERPGIDGDPLAHRSWLRLKVTTF